MRRSSKVSRMVERNRSALDAQPVAITGITGGETEWSYLTWFQTGAGGSKVRYQIEQKDYELSATQPNYNALFSLLLTCWTNHYKVKITYKNPIRIDTSPDPNEWVTYPIESVDALNMSSDDLGQ